MTDGPDGKPPTAKQRACLNAYILFGCSAARMERETDHSARHARRLVRQFPDYVALRQREIDEEVRIATREHEADARAMQAETDAWIDGNRARIHKAIDLLLDHHDPRIVIQAAKLLVSMRSRPSPTRLADPINPEIRKALEDLLKQGDT